jgi:Uma2 family endonuclease
MEITVEKTLEMPDVVLFARKLDAALKEEQKKRQHFYKTVEEDRKVEFINGEVIFQSPKKLWHTQAVSKLSQLLSAQVAKLAVGVVATEKLLISLTRNDYEPDIVFFGLEKSRDFKPTQMQFPAPDLVVEVLSESTERHDRVTKFRDYAAHGVREYWIVDPQHEIVEQYLLEDDEYELILKAGDGPLESRVVAEFNIPIKAIFDKDIWLESLKHILSD